MIAKNDTTRVVNRGWPEAADTISDIGRTFASGSPASMDATATRADAVIVGRFAGANGPDIPHDSDDLDGMVRLLRVVANRLSDRIVAGPEETRGGLVDDCDERSPDDVPFGKKSSALQRNAEASKNSWCSHQVARLPRRRPWQGFGPAFNNEAVRRSCRRQRKA